jgi:predicted HicB family RNase H-like nuclease
MARKTSRAEENALVKDLLAQISKTRPDLAAGLGAQPTREELIDVVADLAPGLESGLRQTSRSFVASLILRLSETGEAPAPVELRSFTTRLPVELIDSVKASAKHERVSVQDWVADALAEHLERVGRSAP